MKRVIRLTAVIILANIFFVVFCAGGVSTVLAQNIPVRWTASIILSPDQVTFAQESGNDLSTSMQTSGVFRSLEESSLYISGSDGMEQMRTALFDDAAPYVDFLSGPIDLTLVMPVGTSPVTLRLEARITAGYQWEVVSDTSASYIQRGESTFLSRYPGYGAPAIQTIQLQPNDAGSQDVKLGMVHKS